jgi:hypothetical protein
MYILAVQSDGYCSFCSSSRCFFFAGRETLSNISIGPLGRHSPLQPPHRHPHPRPLQHSPCPKNWSDDGRIWEGDGQRADEPLHSDADCWRTRWSARPAHRPSISQPSLPRPSLTARAVPSLCAVFISRLWPPRHAATRRSRRATSPRPWTSSARPSPRTPPTPSSTPTEAEHMRR